MGRERVHELWRLCRLVSAIASQPNTLSSSTISNIIRNERETGFDSSVCNPQYLGTKNLFGRFTNRLVIRLYAVLSRIGTITFCDRASRALGRLVSATLACTRMTPGMELGPLTMPMAQPSTLGTGGTEVQVNITALFWISIIFNKIPSYSFLSFSVL